MDKREIRKANSDRLDRLFTEQFGEMPPWVKAVHRTSLTVKYQDCVTGDPRVAKITPEDVVTYALKYHGTAGFQASLRYLGPKMYGDWRPIDSLYGICFTWFKQACRPELVAAAAEHHMTLVS